MTQKSAPKSMGRAYAFKFLYGLLLPKNKEAKEALLNSHDLDKELAQQLKDFDSSYFEPDDEHLLNQMLSTSVQNFAQSLIKEVLLNESELKELVAGSLKKWKIDQLDKVDLTILLMAVQEMKADNQTPHKVVINEAIELSKQYGSKESGHFINGILDSISKK